MPETWFSSPTPSTRHALQQPESWPSVVEIYAALSRTDRCFDSSSELFAAEPQNRDTRGKALPSGSGRGSLVYHLRTQNKGDVALLVFKDPVTDQALRYERIRSQIRDVSAKNFLPFSYRPHELLVTQKGRLHHVPVLLMRWTAQPTLDLWIEENLHRPVRLLLLASRFRAAHFQLGEAQIAHGDLHPWNVTVARYSPEIRWIDYYPLWVPALASNPPPDLGIETFQHPERLSTRYWGPNVDAFPARVIYLTLLVLAHKPALWERFSVPGESLIFGAHDFHEPGKTELWREVLAIRDPQLQIMAQDLMRACEQPISALSPRLPLN